MEYGAGGFWELWFGGGESPTRWVPRIEYGAGSASAGTTEGVRWVPRIENGAGSAPACAGVTFLRRDDGGTRDDGLWAWGVSIRWGGGTGRSGG